MSIERPVFSVCIPAYNRARHLGPLLDSILSQDFDRYEIVICEDMSRERAEIRHNVAEYQAAHPNLISYFENEVNLGFDANIRSLIHKARGRFCFFMGNDDIMCPDALRIASDLIERHENIGFLMRGYAWFDRHPEERSAEVRFFSEERAFSPGMEAIGISFRRSGVISGYIIHRDSAEQAATSKFDGSLYYQMHLTANVLVTKAAVSTPEILVLCRNGEPPEFGNSAAEKDTYTPGAYTPEARLKMIAGVIEILKDLKATRGIDVEEAVMRDYANYFYPYIRDQLTLPFPRFLALHQTFSRMGFSRYLSFHLYFVLGYILGAKRMDSCIKLVRTMLGRSPHFGIASAGSQSGHTGKPEKQASE